MRNREVVAVSEKGQILIPKYYRDRVGIKTGTKVAISTQNNKIVLYPLPDDPIDAACGFLEGRLLLTQDLAKQRRADEKKQSPKLRR